MDSYLAAARLENTICKSRVGISDIISNLAATSVLPRSMVSRPTISARARRAHRGNTIKSTVKQSVWPSPRPLPQAHQHQNHRQTINALPVVILFTLFDAPSAPVASLAWPMNVLYVNPAAFRISTENVRVSAVLRDVMQPTLVAISATLVPQ